MTNAIAEKPKAKETPAPKPVLYQGQAAVADIAVAGNVRVKFDQKAHEELTANVKANGIIEPLVLRPAGKNTTKKYELVCGSRRLAAAKSAGLTDVPVIVRDLTTLEAVEIQVAENLQRKALGSVEEAQAFKLLLDARKYDVKALAELVDKSESYVYQALKLLDLPAKVQEAIEAEALPPTYGHVIAATAAKHHEKLFDYTKTGQCRSIQDLRWKVQQTVEHQLSEAYFPQDVPFAGKVACTACPLNSANQELLIPDAEDGRCMDGACFGVKQRQAEKDFAEKAAARFKGLQSLGTCRRGYDGQPVAPAGGQVLDQKEAADPKVKKLIQEQPEQFGYVVAKPGGYNGGTKLTAHLVCKDPTILPGYKKSEARQEPPRVSKAEQERQDFYHQAISKALFAALIEKTKGRKPGPAEFKALIEDIEVPGGVVLALFGLKESNWNALQNAKKKATDAQAAQLVYLAAHLDSYSTNSAELKALGVDVAAVTKAAEKQAMIDWAAKQSTPKELAKKA